MSIKMIVGYKNLDGTDQDKLFFKYYRTPERVNAFLYKKTSPTYLTSIRKNDKILAYLIMKLSK